MAKKSKTAASRPQPRRHDSAPLRSSPNWPLLAISVAGMALTGYLTSTSFAGASIRGCSAGSGCDVVLTSRWAMLFGLPTALWGFAAYAGLAAIAFIKQVEKHWRFAWTATFLGAAFSVYLTAVSLTVLNATCPYCLTSLLLMTAALALTTVQRPGELKGFSWQKWLTRKIPIAAALVFALHLAYNAEPAAADHPIAGELADHLTASGAKFYGASWCEHCQEQKRFFGSAASRLPYVECKPGSPRAPLTRPCLDANVQRFPTWVIKGERIEGVLTLSELANRSGFQASSTPR